MVSVYRRPVSGENALTSMSRRACPSEHKGFPSLVCQVVWLGLPEISHMAIAEGCFVIITPKQNLHVKKTCLELVCPTGDVFTLTANQTWYVVKAIQEAGLLLRVMGWNPSCGRGPVSNHFDAFVSSDVLEEVCYPCFSPLTFSPLTQTQPSYSSACVRCWHRSRHGRQQTSL